MISETKLALVAVLATVLTTISAPAQTAGIGEDMVELGDLWGEAENSEEMNADSTRAKFPASRLIGYEALSQPNKRVADALFLRQSTMRKLVGVRWSLEEIAYAKQAGANWRQIFHEMQSEGLLNDRNLHRAVSRHDRAPLRPDRLTDVDARGRGRGSVLHGTDRFQHRSKGDAGG